MPPRSIVPSKTTKRPRRLVWKLRMQLSWWRLGLALLDGTSAGSRKNCKNKALAKAKEATKDALAKTQEIKVEIRKLKKRPM
jgi:hypothetical protein